MMSNQGEFQAEFPFSYVSCYNKVANTYKKIGEQ